ncbi:AMP-binding protein, partial [Nocardiopsis sp. LOL_012]|uniref:AMP-binding protein n=1 Tax=Nocardiopsis sp. LOL_012 TaxID=3345409 RepID=UPI003A896C80
VVNPVRSAARNPLFQVMLTLEHATFGTVDLGGTPAVPELGRDSGVAKFDLDMIFERPEDGSGLRGRIGYAVELFDEVTVRRIADVLVRVLRCFAEDADTGLREVEVLSEEEYGRVVHGWNASDREVPDLTVPEVFEGHVRRAPESVAVVFGGERLTYAELDIRANRLARHLVGCGVGRGDVVGVLLERGIDLAVAVLAAAKAGAVYLLLDPGFPEDRIVGMAEDAGARLVVTRSEWTERIPVIYPLVCVDTDAETIAACADRAPDVELDPEDGVCVMFTSGSTGRPKGVLTPHRAVVGTFLGQDFVDLGPDHVWLQCAPVSWDGFALEFWGALMSGSRCVLQPGQAPEPELIESLAAEH